MTEKNDEQTKRLIHSMWRARLEREPAPAPHLAKAHALRLRDEVRREVAEMQERQEKQAQLEAHLRRRGEVWRAHTGSPPGTDLLARWQQEFVEERVAEQELDREVRLAQAIEESYDY
jgi:hypothetical protein